MLQLRTYTRSRIRPVLLNKLSELTDGTEGILQEQLLDPTIPLVACVAFSGRDPVAWACAAPDPYGPDRSLTAHVYVRSDLRRKGIGLLVMKGLAKRLAKNRLTKSKLIIYSPGAGKLFKSPLRNYGLKHRWSDLYTHVFV